jgi:hypothetical protein
MNRGGISWLGALLAVSVAAWTYAWLEPPPAPVQVREPGADPLQFHVVLDGTAWMRALANRVMQERPAGIDWSSPDW